MLRALLLACSLVLAARASAGGDDPVLVRMAAQLARGEPVVFQVHVALCDNTVIRCGGHGLGDGDAPRTNLYWGTSEGLRGWLGEQATGWKLVEEKDQEAGGDLLKRSIWRRHIVPSAALKARGIAQPFSAYLVIDAWRGKKIDAAIEAFVTDLFGEKERVVSVAGTTLRAGGAAAVVAWVGHNRFMDYADDPWPRVLALRSAPKGAIAIACFSEDYLRAALERAGQVPLMLTKDFVMASGAPLIGALNSLLDGGDLLAQRKAATAEYARGQKKDAAKLSRVFRNASSPHW